MKKKRCILLFFVALLILPQFIQSAVLHEESHTSQDSFDIENLTYTIIINSNDRISVITDEFNLIVKNEECNDHKTIKICIDSLLWDEVIKVGFEEAKELIDGLEIVDSPTEPCLVMFTYPINDHGDTEIAHKGLMTSESKVTHKPRISAPLEENIPLHDLLNDRPGAIVQYRKI